MKNYPGIVIDRSLKNMDWTMVFQLSSWISNHERERMPYRTLVRPTSNLQ